MADLTLVRKPVRELARLVRARAVSPVVAAEFQNDAR